MDKRPVLFVDSGIGGIPYAHFFFSRNRGERLVYIADTANFPYGPKPKEMLVGLVLGLVGRLVSKYDPKILVIACNTASVSALSALRESFTNIPIVGTVPAIKSAVLASRNRRIGVLGTQRTLEDPYIDGLVSQYGADCEIVREAAAGLVDFAEHRWLTADNRERLDAVKPWVEKFRQKGADALVLACTHFLLLLDEVRNAAGNDLQVFDSIDGVSRRIEFILDENGLRSGLAEAGAPLLELTGEAVSAGHWQGIAGHFGFCMETLK